MNVIKNRKILSSIQHDSMQCGVACIQMVCDYYGKNYPLDYLDQLCSATNEGVSLLGMDVTANQLGIKTVSKELSAEELISANMPCILHWNQNHFVVLYRASKNGQKFYVATCWRN